MTSDLPEPIGAPGCLRQLEKIERYPNPYRLRLPGNEPGKPTDLYYAVIERSRKQFRRSLRTYDRKLALPRLSELKDKIGNLAVAEEVKLTFDAVAERWLARGSNTTGEGRERSRARVATLLIS